MTTEHPMQLGMVGLGRMGANLVQRLVRDGHNCVVYDVNSKTVETLVGSLVVRRISQGTCREPRGAEDGVAHVARGNHAKYSGRIGASAQQ